MAKKLDFELTPDETEKNDERYCIALPAKLKAALVKLPKSRNKKLREFIQVLVEENAS